MRSYFGCAVKLQHDKKNTKIYKLAEYVDREKVARLSKEEEKIIYEKIKMAGMPFYLKKYKLIPRFLKEIFYWIYR